MFNLYDNIRILCKERGISPSKMCVDCGLSKTIVSRLKSDENKQITIETAKVFADYLGVSVDRVLHGVDESSELQVLLDDERTLLDGYRTMTEEQKMAMRIFMKGIKNAD